VGSLASISQTLSSENGGASKIVFSLMSHASEISRRSLPLNVTWSMLRNCTCASFDSFLLGRTTATSNDGSGGGGSSFSIPARLGVGASAMLTIASAGRWE
jgi:hypothetical protein